MTSFLGFIFPGGAELWIVLAIVLLLFGHRIPAMARSMGSGIVEFKRGLKDPEDSDKGAPPPSGPAGGPAGGSDAAKRPHDTPNPNG
jgi:sec-independent protein translocase protein TatA